MKKFMVMILFILGSFYSFAQNDKPIKDTLIKGVQYQLFQGSRGGRYIWLISKKTNLKYKKYFKS